MRLLFRLPVSFSKIGVVQVGQQKIFIPKARFASSAVLEVKAMPSPSSQAPVAFHAMPAMIGPSLLACDMSRMADEAKRVLDAGADFLHLDVMDGHFVPNLTFGAPVIACLKKHTGDAILDVHLMVTNPERWVDDMKNAGADYFTFHVEVGEDLEPLINRIKATGMKVGLAIKPKTPPESVYPYAHLLDLILVMTVEPGFGGQKFNQDMIEKVLVILFILLI